MSEFVFEVRLGGFEQREEIIRCKDCFQWDDQIENGNAVCYEWSDPENGYSVYTSPNDFCSRAERWEP